MRRAILAGAALVAALAMPAAASADTAVVDAIAPPGHGAGAKAKVVSVRPGPTVKTFGLTVQHRRVTYRTKSGRTLRLTVLGGPKTVVKDEIPVAVGNVERFRYAGGAVLADSRRVLKASPRARIAATTLACSDGGTAHAIPAPGRHYRVWQRIANSSMKKGHWFSFYGFYGSTFDTGWQFQYRVAGGLNFDNWSDIWTSTLNVSDGAFGYNGWAGIVQYNESGTCYPRTGSQSLGVRYNSSYFNTAADANGNVSSYTWPSSFYRHLAEHEKGHVLGLGHDNAEPSGVMHTAVEADYSASQGEVNIVSYVLAAYGI